MHKIRLIKKFKGYKFKGGAILEREISLAFLPVIGMQIHSSELSLHVKVKSLSYNIDSDLFACHVNSYTFNAGDRFIYDTAESELENLKEAIPSYIEDGWKLKSYDGFQLEHISSEPESRSSPETQTKCS